MLSFFFHMKENARCFQIQYNMTYKSVSNMLDSNYALIKNNQS